MEIDGTNVNDWEFLELSSVSINLFCDSCLERLSNLVIFGRDIPGFLKKFPHPGLGTQYIMHPAWSSGIKQF